MINADLVTKFIIWHKKNWYSKQWGEWTDNYNLTAFMKEEFNDNQNRDNLISISGHLGVGGRETGYMWGKQCSLVVG